MEYFSHDYNSREDEKIQKLIFKKGFEGYGIYWALIEMLYQNDGFIEPEYERIAFALHTQSDIINSVINDFGLFEKHGKRISSKSVLHRLQKRKGKSEKARQAAQIRWNQDVKGDADAMQMHSERNANKAKQSKAKNSKVNKTKYSEFVFLKDQEHRTLVEKYGEHNTKRCIETLNNYKASSGKTYRSDYHAIHSWVIDRLGIEPEKSGRFVC